MWLFFFQAEDGIRGWSVTGVQTCALPICSSIASVGRAHGDNARAVNDVRIFRIHTRSEERRVGKEFRSRGTTFHLKNDGVAPTDTKEFTYLNDTGPLHYTADLDISVLHDE